MRVYGQLWAVTCAAALLAAAVPGLAAVVRARLGLELDGVGRAGDFSVALLLVVHNGIVAGWPLALELLGLRSVRGVGRCFACLVHGSLVLSGLVVGLALGAYGWRLFGWVPQLPLEWLALAAGAAGWLSRAAGRLRMRAFAVAVAVVLAAAIEAFVVPVG